MYIYISIENLYILHIDKRLRFGHPGASKKEPTRVHGHRVYDLDHLACWNYVVLHALQPYTHQHMCICMQLCMFLNKVQVFVWAYEHVDLSICMCIGTLMPVEPYICTQQRMYIHVKMCVYECLHVYAPYAYVYVYVYVCVYTCVAVHLYKSIHPASSDLRPTSSAAHRRSV